MKLICSACGTCIKVYISHMVTGVTLDGDQIKRSYDK